MIREVPQLSWKQTYPVGDLIGIDFDRALDLDADPDNTNNPSPLNWTQQTEKAANLAAIATPVVLDNLIDESGSATEVQLTIGSLDGTFQAELGTPLASQIPLHSNNEFDELAGNIRFDNHAKFHFSGLVTTNDYEVYVFGLATVEQTQQVTIIGSGDPILFQQDLAANQLMVNDVAGSSEQMLSSFAIILKKK